jgi:flagellar hook-associated protein 2
MATVGSTGSSMIDVPTIVSQLMTVERRPLTALQTKQSSYQSKLSAYGAMQSAISTFQTAVSSLASTSNFKSTTASSSNTSVLTATATSSSTIGSHSINVSQIAQSQKLVAAGQTTTTAAIGVGTLSFDFGTISGGTLNTNTGLYTGASFANSGAGTKTVTIDSTHNSLQGIRDAINAAGIGITASIINDGSGTPYRLALSSSSTGAASSMKISVTGDAALSNLLSYDASGTQNLSQTAAAQDAKLTIDGVAISRSTNTVANAIEGVSLSLLAPSTSAVTLDVARDTTSVVSQVQSFATAFNTLNSKLSSATAYATGNSTSASVLQGDSMLRSFQTQVRNILSSSVGTTGSYQSLSSIGVSFQRDGSLQVDTTKLTAAINSSATDVAAVFANTGNATDSLVSYSGATTATKSGSYAVNVSQLATQGTLTGTSAANLTISSGSNDTLSLKVDGISATVTLSAGTYTAASLAAELQSKINGASAISSAAGSVSVTESGGVLSLTSAKYGSTSGITITGGNASADLFGASTNQTNGVDVTGTINGRATTGSGQYLTSSTGDSSGLAIQINGGTTGARGTLTYSQGVAYQINQLATSFLATDGALAGRTSSINTSISSLDRQISDMQARLQTIQTRYTTQYSKLDALLGSMNSTSTFLTQQLAALSANSRA